MLADIGLSWITLSSIQCEKNREKGGKPLDFFSLSSDDACEMIFSTSLALFTISSFACVAAFAPAKDSPVWSPSDLDQFPMMKSPDDLMTTAKRPFSPLDMVQLDRVGPAQVDPSGKHVVFTCWHYHVDTNKNSKSLWLLSLPTGADGMSDSMPVSMDKRLRPITEAIQGVTDDEPVWLNDHEVAFLRTGPPNSKRAKIPQLFKVSIASSLQGVPDGVNGIPKAIELFPENPLPLDIGNLKYHSAGGYLTFTAEVFANEQSSLDGRRSIERTVFPNVTFHRTL